MMHTVRRLAKTEKSGCRYRSTSYMERRRREANKKDFIPLPNESDLFLAFPNERLGNHYNVNWTLAGYGCPPLGHNAFYNLHERHLKMYCDGELGAKKEIVCKRENVASQQYFVNDGYGSHNFSGSKVIDADQWRRLMLEMTTHVADSVNIFMTDFTIGSRGSEVRVRVISNDANASLFIKNLYHGTTSSREQVDEFKPQIVVYHDPYFVPSSQGTGVESSAFTVSMLMSGAAALDCSIEPVLNDIPAEEKQEIAASVAGILMLGGTESLSELQSSLARLASHFHQQKQVVPLNADVISTKDGHYALVVDSVNYLTSKGTNPLHKAQGCLWSANGVYSSYRGITHTNPAAVSSTGSLVWSDGKKQNVTEAVGGWSAAQQPSAIVQLVESGPAVAKGDLKQLASSLSVLPAGYPFQSEFGVSDFLTATQNIPVYLVNATQKDVQEVLKQIADGTFVLGQNQKPKSSQKE